MNKRIVCLANSRMPSGRCVAGREWSRKGEAGDWIRAVSSREGHSVSEHERQYEDGSDLRLLDIVTIPMLERRPDRHQTENWLIDDTEYWRKEGTFPRHDLDALVDPVEPLWVDGVSTRHGANDKVWPESLEAVAGSLRLIRVDALEIGVFAPSEAFGNSKRRVLGSFAHSGRDYAMWITDPAYEKKYLRKLDGRYGLDECYLTVSLGLPYDYRGRRYPGACYKFIAGIVEASG